MPAESGHVIHVISYAETHIPTMCNSGFAIADVMKRGGVTAKISIGTNTRGTRPFHSFRYMC